MVQWEDYTYIIDCGPDFRQQMLKHEVSRIDGILFTHEHADHTAGLDDIRPFFFRQGDIPVYAHSRVLQSLAKRFDYIFSNEDKYPGVPSVKPHIILPDTPVMLGDLEVIPVSAWHNRLQVFGFRFGDFAYLTDVKSMEEQEMEKLSGVEVLVVNALRITPHHSHFNLEEALDFVAKVRPGRAYFTHISHRMGFHAEVERQLPEDVFLAYDNLILEI